MTRTVMGKGENRSWSSGLILRGINTNFYISKRFPIDYELSNLILFLAIIAVEPCWQRVEAASCLSLMRHDAMATLPHTSNWINGAFTSPSSPQLSIQVVNPATELAFATIDATPETDVAQVVSNAYEIFDKGTWAHSSASERFTVLSKAARLLRERILEFADLETQQTGRPLREMRTQLSRVPEWLDYFASLARTSEGRVTPFKGPVINTLTRLPLGVVAQITPWNHPLLIAIKKIGAALAASNVVIVKPSELAPLCVLRLGPLFKESGLPDGVLQIISGYGRETGKYLCGNRLLAKIDRTGGLATYQAIASVASVNLTQITAELGGKAAVCILPSMDIVEAVKAALFASFIASGQTCVTGSRILVHQDIYEPFLSLLVKRTQNLRLGNPTDLQTQIGAVINEAAVHRCAAFVERALSEGGKILCGGKLARVSGRGFFFEPTLVETHADSELAQEEVFGPVIALIKCSSEEHMIQIANGTRYALGTSVWTNDFSQGHRIAQAIDAGLVWINCHHLNDPSSPWGGFKESGMGKENGEEAYNGYTKVKSTVINYGTTPDWFDDDAVGARYG